MRDRQNRQGKLNWRGGSEGSSASHCVSNPRRTVLVTRVALIE